MKIILPFMSLPVLVFISVCYPESQQIISGTYPGEIYFVGGYPNRGPYHALYYSSDYGATAVMRDSCSIYENGYIELDKQTG